MGNKIVVTPNDRYGRMVIIKEVEPAKSGKRRVLCKCDCGNTKIVGLTHLRCGETTSCGCYRKEQSSVTHKRHGFGDYRYRLYKIWTGIKERCTNPNSTSYSRNSNPCRAASCAVLSTCNTSDNCTNSIRCCYRMFLNGSAA